MNIFLWSLIAIGLIACLVSWCKRKRNQVRNRRDTQYQQQKRIISALASEIFKEERKEYRQMNSVSNTKFQKYSFMNTNIHSTYCLLEALLSMSHPTHRVFVRLPSGEFSGCDNKPASGAFDSKRADFVITDSTGQPVVVVEYYGENRHSSLCDAVELEVRNSTGIVFIKLPACYSEANIIAIGKYLPAKAN